MLMQAYLGKFDLPKFIEGTANLPVTPLYAAYFSLVQPELYFCMLYQFNGNQSNMID